MSDQIYQVITPVGLFNAEFGIDDEPITYTGDKVAISWFNEFLNQASIKNQYGQSISFLRMSPEEMYYFCQPENSGIKVIPSFEDLAFYLNDNNDDDDMLDSVNDDLDASGIIGWFDNTLDKIANKDIGKGWIAFPDKEWTRNSDYYWYVCPKSFYEENGYVEDGHAFDGIVLEGLEEVADHILYANDGTNGVDALKRYGFEIIANNKSFLDSSAEDGKNKTIDWDKVSLKERIEIAIDAGLNKSVGEKSFSDLTDKEIKSINNRLKDAIGDGYNLKGSILDNARNAFDGMIDTFAEKLARLQQRRGETDEQFAKTTNVNGYDTSGIVGWFDNSENPTQHIAGWFDNTDNDYLDEASQQTLITDKIKANDSGLDAFDLLKDLLTESVAVNKKSMAHLYEYDDKRTRKQRIAANKAAEAILDKVKNENYQVTEEDKAVLAKYSGNGGALEGADGMKGSQYEYYTPTPIAEGMWALMRELGFNGGKVLDPSSGTGIFGATSPSNAVIDAVELSEVSGMVQKLVNDNAFYTTTIAPFEKVAANNPDEIYDAVITNVPFGDTSARGDNFMHDTKYRKETLQGYFILRSLEKLKPRGLAAFIVPPSVVTGLDEKSISVRQRASMMAEFVGAYRLPNEVFGTAAADTMTDVIVFRKFSKEVAEKIAELREQSPQTLIDAKVQWDTFLDGRWFKENKRFILGEETVTQGKWGEKPAVTSNASMPELGAMLKKFPKSRIDWDLLDSTETDPIVYKNGDTIVQSGQTLRYKNGTWEALPHNEDSVYIAQLLAKCDNPYAAFIAQVSWEDVFNAATFMRNTARGLEIPKWLSKAANGIARLGKDEQSKYWDASVVALAMNQALEQHIGSVGFNYLETYPELSTAIQQIAKIASKPDTRLTGNAKDALKSVRNHYDIKTGFSKFWLGQTATLEAKASDADTSFEGLMYQNRSKWINLDDAKAVLGPDFNEFENTDYCLSGDGKKLIKADDYYVGNLNDFLVKLDAEIEQAKGNDKLIGKLLNQRAEALNRVDTVDVSQMNFTLFSPFITVEEKLEFVKQFVNPNAMIVTNNKGQKVVDIEITGSKLSDDDKLAKRFGDYLMNRTLTVAGTKFDKYDNIGALRELRKMTVQANTNFDAWVKARPDIMARLNQQSSDAKSLRFRPVDDEAELTIAGMNPELKLHGYQCSFVRQKAREFSGINGFSVGLGKTFTALASVQYAQNMGVKNKTIFVVPNSVLSNWKKETARAYSTIDDCLFVGLRTDKNGNERVNSSEYAVDLSRIMENQHKKIFMTYEAFQMIRLKDTSIEGFANYLRDNDASLEFTSDKKTDEKIKGYLALITSAVTDKKGNVPFLDDMGVDSIVIDEAHLLKNAAEANNFKSAKYLSLPNASKRAIDAQAKLWFIRGKSPLKDGVLLLTATPITNSPLEIFSMLTLSSGHEKLRDLCMGARGADDFMEMVCDKENEDDVSIDGIERTIDVFKGLNNVSILRNAIKNTTTIKNAEDVGDQIIVPDAETDVADLQLGDDIIDMLKQYKGAFRYAVDYMAERKENRGDYQAFVKTGAKFDLTVELLGHPFNLLKNMELLVMDKELDERATFFTFPKEQLALAKKVIEQFNGKKISADRPRLNPYTKNPEAVKGVKSKVDDVTGDVKEWYQIHVQAYLIDADTRIVIDTMDTLQISDFEDLADKAGLTLDCTIPPKIAALLDNVSKELTNPRGLIKNGDGVESTPIVKQIIFCDILATHNKIRRLLTKKCGIPAGKIATVTGKTNNEADAILEVQNGFNANGEDNKYQIILANEKAEVGINLQIGTQAIHHLTIGWTPDSLTQRNGRGQRQGNQTKKVNIYYYDADGTFDKQKRAMVERKGDWINDLMSNQSTNKIEVTGGMSREQMEVLMESVGDKDAMARYQDMLQAKEAEARAKTNRDKQLINLTTISKQAEWLNVNPTAEASIKSALNDLNNLVLARDKIYKRKATTATAEAKNQAAIAEFDTAIDALAEKINSSCTIYKVDYKEEIDKDYPSGVGALAIVRNIKDWFYSSRGKSFLEMMQGGYGTYFKFDLINDGPIVTQWQNNKTLAENMIESSVKNFENQATEKGAIPSVVARAIAEGKGLLMNGKPVIVGSIASQESNGNTYFGIVESVNTIENKVDIVVLGSDRLRTFNATSIAELTITIQGTPEYDKLAKEIAKIEDDKYSTVGIDTKLLSDYSVDIANYRTKKQKVRVSADRYILPPPYFPIIITGLHAETPLIQKIAESQKAAVESIVLENGEYYAGVDKSLNIERATGYVDNMDAFMPELMRYAKAHGLTIGFDDLPLAGGDVRNLSFSDFDSINKVYFDKSSVINEIRNKALELDIDTFDLKGVTYLGNDLVGFVVRQFMESKLKKELNFLDDELFEKMVQGNYFYLAITEPVAKALKAKAQGDDNAIKIERIRPLLVDAIKQIYSSISSTKINNVLDFTARYLEHKDTDYLTRLIKSETVIYYNEITQAIVNVLTEQGLLDA